MIDYSGATAARMSRTEGRIRGTGWGMAYPSPFFDVAHTYLPDTIKQMFRWCRYYTLTNPLIAAVVNKMAEYPITDILIETDSEGTKKLWTNFFEDVLQLRAFLVDIGLFYGCYGNAIVSINYPFRKFLVCRGCGKFILAEKADFKFRNLKFFLKCECGRHSEADVKDIPVKSPREIKLILWNPEDISIKYNDITGKATYYYSIPNALRNDITIGKRDTVTQTPQIFIDAVKSQKSVILNPDNIFHFRRPSILAGPKDKAWGIPLVLPVLKDVFYLQVLKKAQEAIALERMLPLTVLFPQPGSGSSDPYASISLTKWRDHVGLEVQRWRQDKNYIPIMPLPIGSQNIGGDGRALLLSQEIRVWSEHIVAGMGVPQEFIFGGLQYCLDGDTLVHTQNGFVKAKTLCPDTPQSRSSDGQLKLRTSVGMRDVAVMHNTGTKDGFLVEVDGGIQNKCAGTHKYKVLRPDLSIEWVNAEDLSSGDKVAVLFGQGGWPNKALRLNWPGRAEGRKSRIESFIPDVVTPELSRLLGYIVSEGHIRKNEISIGQKDRLVAEDIARCASAVFRRPFTVGSDEFNQVRVCGADEVHFLKWCGCDGNSKTISVPWIILQSCERDVSSFLSAYFEGDGYVEDVDKKQAVGAGSQSARLLREVQILLMNFGITSRIYDPRFESDVYRIVVSSDDVDTFARSVGFISDRKKLVLLSRTPVKPEAKKDMVIPYLKEAMDRFCDEFFPTRSRWVWKPVIVPVEEKERSTSEVADVIGCSTDMVRRHIRSGRLAAKMTRNGYSVPHASLLEFCSCFGRGKRVKAPRLYWKNGRCDERTLETIKQYDECLYESINYLQTCPYVWRDVKSVSPIGKINTVDFTMERDPHDYWAAGLVCHNSGSNVSLRMLENQLLRYVSDQLRMVKNFIVKNIAAWMDWPLVNVRFKPFKMADDLQRRAFDFQLNQAGKLSDTSLLANSDYDPIKEDEQMAKETIRRLEAVGKQQMAEAQIAIDAQAIQAKGQAKIQQIMSQEQQQAMSGQANTAPGESQEGQQQAQTQPQQTPSSGGGVAGQQKQVMAQQMAQRLTQYPQDQQQSIISQIASQDPELAQMVQQYLQQMMKQQGSAQQGSAGKPLPEQLPPRRGAENAVI